PVGKGREAAPATYAAKLSNLFCEAQNLGPLRAHFATQGRSYKCSAPWMASSPNCKVTDIGARGKALEIQQNTNESLSIA
ncbi:hypothetical protein PpSQ1_27110, partial [Pseudomonas putida]